MTKGKIEKTVTQKLRCAIYTRKSSEEGLEMEFNSLDAQRDACCKREAKERLVPLARVPAIFAPFSKDK